MKSLRLTTLFTLLLLASPALRAATLYWDADATSGASLGGTGNWDTATALWYNGTADLVWNNANNDDAVFTGTGGTVTLTTGITAGDLYFTNVTGSVIITNATGATLTLGNGVVDTGGGDDIIGAALAGSQTLTKNGAGTLELNGANSGFSGAVNANDGAIEVENTGALGSGLVTVTNDASVEFTSGGTIANAFDLSGNGVNNTGALLNIANSPVINGVVTMESTNIVIGSDSGILDLEGGVTVPSGVNANVTFTGPSFRVSYTATAKVVHLGTGSITINGGGLNIESTSITFSNMVINNGTYAFGTKDAGFGTAPSTFSPSNIVLNGGVLQCSHTLTVNGNRGIFLSTNGGSFAQNTGSAQTTVPGAISGPGNLEIQKDGSGSSWKLTGNNSYTGVTTIDSGASLIIGSGSTSGTFGTGNIVNNGSLTSNRSGLLTNSCAVSGPGTVSIQGAAVTTLTGASTYTGATTIDAYLVQVDNTNGNGTGTGAVTVQSPSILGGNGSMGGPVTIDTGATLQPGDAYDNLPGALTMTNSLTLQSGSSCVLDLDATVPTNSAVLGLTSVTFGGTLEVNLVNGTPVAGQTYQLFGARSYSGVFDGGISLPGLPSGLTWNTNSLYVNGTISVVPQSGLLSQPVLSGTNIVLSGTSGTPYGTFSVLSSTNLTLPVANWTVVSTGNPFDGNGDFDVTNPVDPAAAQEYFMISQP